MKSRITRKIISTIVACLFLFNNIAYGLSPMPGSTQPGTQSGMYALGQKLFAAKRGPGAIDFDRALPPGFYGQTPKVEGVTSFRKADYENIPAGWANNKVNRELIESKDLISALRCFRKNEAQISGNLLSIEEGYFEVNETDGELPIARIERLEGGKGKLVVHTKFVQMWNDLLKNDIWFDYTFPNGEKRTASLAWAIFYRLAKHEMMDVERKRSEYKGGGHVTPATLNPDSYMYINLDEVSANEIGGRYKIINDSMWMWFLGSYCFGNTTRFDNDTLRKRLHWFFNGKAARRLKLDQEFPNLTGPSYKHKRDFAIRLALNINKEYFSKKDIRVPEFTVDKKFIDAYQKRAPKISDSYYATGGAGDSPETIFDDLCQMCVNRHDEILGTITNIATHNTTEHLNLGDLLFADAYNVNVVVSYTTQGQSIKDAFEEGVAAITADPGKYRGVFAGVRERMEARSFDRAPLPEEDMLLFDCLADDAKALILGEVLYGKYSSTDSAERSAPEAESPAQTMVDLGRINDEMNLACKAQERPHYWVRLKEINWDTLDDQRKIFICEKTSAFTGKNPPDTLTLLNIAVIIKNKPQERRSEAIDAIADRFVELEGLSLKAARIRARKLVAFIGITFANFGDAGDSTQDVSAELRAQLADIRLKISSLKELADIINPDFIADILPGVEDMINDTNPAVSEHARRMAYSLRTRAKTAAKNDGQPLTEAKYVLPHGIEVTPVAGGVSVKVFDKEPVIISSSDTAFEIETKLRPTLLPYGIRVVAYNNDNRVYLYSNSLSESTVFVAPLRNPEKLGDYLAETFGEITIVLPEDGRTRLIVNAANADAAESKLIEALEGSGIGIRVASTFNLTLSRGTATATVNVPFKPAEIKKAIDELHGIVPQAVAQAPAKPAAPEMASVRDEPGQAAQPVTPKSLKDLNMFLESVVLDANSAYHVRYRAMACAALLQTGRRDEGYIEFFRNVVVHNPGDFDTETRVIACTALLQIGLDVENARDFLIGVALNKEETYSTAVQAMACAGLARTGHIDSSTTDFLVKVVERTPDKFDMRTRLIASSACETSQGRFLVAGVMQDVLRVYTDEIRALSSAVGLQLGIDRDTAETFLKNIAILHPDEYDYRTHLIAAIALVECYSKNAKSPDSAQPALPAINPTTTTAWQNLTADFRDMRSAHLRDLFSDDPDRVRRFSEDFASGAAQLHLDYSKNRITHNVKTHLVQLADEARLTEATEQMFSGERINATENRAVLHVALRMPRDSSLVVDGKDVIPDVHRVLDHMERFSRAINSGEWKGYTGKPITDIVNIGIGGSDLGPVMATEALKPYATGKVKVHFVSNIDGTDITEKVIKRLNPETTLFIIASKTFTTQETMTNAQTAKQWFLEHAKDQEAIKKHFVAISTNNKEVEKFGIDTANMFEFWDWVGGRYSLWSAIGLSIATYVGFDNFRELLAGANGMDEHFRKTPFEHNIPVILALLDIWYTNFLGAETHAILPYDQYLHRLPAYLQQAFMESNGKSVDRNGNPINYATCPVIWGEAGTNGQHSFYQKIHQGGRVIPADFIGISTPQNPVGDHHEKFLANFFAQTRALAFGKTLQAVLGAGVDPLIAMHRVFNGNNPTTSILINKLSPRSLGALIAMYEHQIFVEGVILNIYSFDQWGVELGKVEAAPILKDLKGEAANEYDASTTSLMAQHRKQTAAANTDGVESEPAQADKPAVEISPVGAVQETPVRPDSPDSEWQTVEVVPAFTNPALDVAAASAKQQAADIASANLAGMANIADSGASMIWNRIVRQRETASPVSKTVISVWITLKGEKQDTVVMNGSEIEFETAGLTSETDTRNTIITLLNRAASKEMKNRRVDNFHYGTLEFNRKDGKLETGLYIDVREAAVPGKPAALRMAKKIDVTAQGKDSAIKLMHELGPWVNPSKPVTVAEMVELLREQRAVQNVGGEDLVFTGVSEIPLNGQALEVIRRILESESMLKEETPAQAPATPAATAKAGKPRDIRTQRFMETETGNPKFVLGQIATSPLARNSTFTVKDVLSLFAERGHKISESTLRDDLYGKPTSLEKAGMITILNPDHKGNEPIVLKWTDLGKARTAFIRAREYAATLDYQLRDNPRIRGWCLLETARGAVDERWKFECDLRNNPQMSPAEKDRRQGVIRQEEDRYALLVLGIDHLRFLEDELTYFSTINGRVEYRKGYYGPFIAQINLRKEELKSSMSPRSASQALSAAEGELGLSLDRPLGDLTGPGGELVLSEDEPLEGAAPEMMSERDESAQSRPKTRPKPQFGSIPPVPPVATGFADDYDDEYLIQHILAEAERLEMNRSQLIYNIVGGSIILRYGQATRMVDRNFEQITQALLELRKEAQDFSSRRPLRGLSKVRGRLPASAIPHTRSLHKQLRPYLPRHPKTDLFRLREPGDAEEGLVGSEAAPAQATAGVVESHDEQPSKAVYDWTCPIEKVRSYPVSAFGKVGVRLSKAFETLGIKTVGDLLDKTIDDFLEIKGVGIMTVNALHWILVEHRLPDLKFRNETTEPAMQATPAQAPGKPAALRMAKEIKVQAQGAPQEKALTIPEAISVYAARLGLDEGPGAEELTQEIASFYPIYEMLKTQRVEIYFSQFRVNSLTQSVKDEIAGHNKRIRERAGIKEDAISVIPYNSSNLGTILARPAGKNVKRIFVNDPSMEEAFSGLLNTDKGLELIRGNRFFSGYIAQGADDLENSVRQAWLTKVSILSCLLTEENMPTVGAALKDELDGRVQGDVGTFLGRMAIDDDHAAGIEDIRSRAKYFLGTIVKLSEFTAIQLRVLKAFWMAA